MQCFYIFLDLSGIGWAARKPMRQASLQHETKLFGSEIPFGGRGRFSPTTLDDIGQGRWKMEGGFD